MAIRAEQPQVFEAVVVMDPVDVIEMQTSGHACHSAIPQTEHRYGQPLSSNRLTIALPFA